MENLLKSSPTAPPSSAAGFHTVAGDRWVFIGASVSHAGKIRDLNKREMEINVAEPQGLKGTVGHAHFLPLCAAPSSPWLNTDYFNQISWRGKWVGGRGTRCCGSICISKHLRVSLKQFTRKAALDVELFFCRQLKRKRIESKSLSNEHCGVYCQLCTLN